MKYIAGAGQAVAGVGCDIHSLHQVEAALGAYGSRYIQKILGPSEWDQKDIPLMELTQRFAVKEAVAKALAVKWDEPLPWPSIELSPLLCVQKGEAWWSIRLGGWAARSADRQKIKEWKAWSWQENGAVGSFGCAVAVALTV